MLFLTRRISIEIWKLRLKRHGSIKLSRSQKSKKRRRNQLQRKHLQPHPRLPLKRRKFKRRRKLSLRKFKKHQLLHKLRLKRLSLRKRKLLRSLKRSKKPLLQLLLQHQLWRKRPQRKRQLRKNKSHSRQAQVRMIWPLKCKRDVTKINRLKLKREPLLREVKSKILQTMTSQLLLLKRLKNKSKRKKLLKRKDWRMNN